MSVRIELLPDPSLRGLDPTGGVTCEQGALVTVDPETLREIWTASTLELFARSYWDYIRRRTLGAVRVVHGGHGPTVTLFGRIPLLGFRPPVFSTGADRASVEWPIERGILVARDGRGQGFLRIAAERDPEGAGPDRRLRVSSSVSNFYPWLRGRGRMARAGTWLYSQTQLRVHIAVTRGFLRTLESLPDDVLRRGVAVGPNGP